MRAILVADKHDVVCLDNFYTGTRANIIHLLQHPRFELIRHDVAFSTARRMDEIYNLA